MIITKKCLPRRAVLRGLGVTLALPWLDSMVPALTALSKTAVTARRLGVFYVPNGMSMAYWSPKAEGARNHTQCDSLLIGDLCGAHTVPYIEVKNRTAKVEHEATTSKIGEDQLFYCRQRGLSAEDAVSMIVNGFCKEVFKELPMEFAVEARKLLSVSLEGSVG